MSIQELETSSASGNGRAVHELGYRYERGIRGVEQNFGKAAGWYCMSLPKPGIVISKDSEYTSPSLERLKTFAEAEGLEPSAAVKIYCEQKQPPKPSLESYSPLRVSWCGGQSTPEFPECKWFEARRDKGGQPLDSVDAASLALKELPPQGRSRDWFLNLVWRFGFYHVSHSGYGWDDYTNDMVPSDSKMRSNFTMVIHTKYIGPLLVSEDGKTYAVNYKKPDRDIGNNPITWKLLMEFSKELSDCFDNAHKKRFAETMILFQDDSPYSKKYGKTVRVHFIRDCYGRTLHKE